MCEKCMSCKIKKKWKDPKYREKQLKTRKSKEYRLMMKKTMQNSKAWKEKQPIRNTALREYWKEKRGGKKLEAVLTEWELYRKLVYKYTESNYKKYKKHINPNNLSRGKRKYHIDHKFSVLEGFKNNILPRIIAHPFNLEMLIHYENHSKDCNCSITMDQLLRRATIR